MTYRECALLERMLPSPRGQGPAATQGVTQTMDAILLGAIVPRSQVPELFGVVILGVIAALAIIQLALSARSHH